MLVRDVERHRVDYDVALREQALEDLVYPDGVDPDLLGLGVLAAVEDADQVVCA